ncbi:MAG: hypothetical protein WCJ30_02145, partial [Deltaproteobacteria bacterium]
MRFKKQFFLLFILSAAITIRLTAQTWIVPDDQKAIRAPMKFTPEMQKQGEQIYLKNCQSCHGESEKHAKHSGSGKPPQVDRSFRKGTTTSAEARSETCTTCHKGGSKMFWPTSMHAARDVTCSNCHQVHNGKDMV